MIGSKSGNRAIYIDEENREEILAYIRQDERHKKKFKFIAELILEGHRNTELYDKEEINSKCKGVTAMKFFKGQDNDRIYCREIISPKGVFIVVAAHLLEKKKTQQINKKIKTLLENIGGFEYEI